MTKDYDETMAMPNVNYIDTPTTITQTHRVDIIRQSGAYPTIGRAFGLPPTNDNYAGLGEQQGSRSAEGLRRGRSPLPGEARPCPAPSPRGGKGRTNVRNVLSGGDHYAFSGASGGLGSASSPGLAGGPASRPRASSPRMLGPAISRMIA